MNIRVKFKDRQEILFEHRPRSGGSWDLSYRLENGWIVIKDEWEREVIYPMDSIEEVRIE